MKWRLGSDIMYGFWYSLAVRVNEVQRSKIAVPVGSFHYWAKQ